MNSLGIQSTTAVLSAVVAIGCSALCLAWSNPSASAQNPKASAIVIELQDTNHYVYIVDEALVVREVRKFLLEK